MGSSCKRSRGVVVAILFAIILTGVLIRIRGLTLRSFWFDEAFSWRMTQFSPGELFVHVAHDNHPPLFFILLKAWSEIAGDSVIASADSVFCFPLP